MSDLLTPSADSGGPLRASPGTARPVAIALLLLAMGLSSPATAIPPLPAWDALSRSIVKISVEGEGEEGARHGFGFLLADVPGVITTYQLVHGAARTSVQPFQGEAVTTSRYVVHDVESDLVVLDAEVAVAPLRRGSSGMLAIGQSVFLIAPPTESEPATAVRYYTHFATPGAERLIAHGAGSGVPVGAPLADSLGRVVGIAHLLRDGETRAAAAVPIETVFAALARPEMGGELTSLDAPPAAWLDARSPAGAQALGAALSRARRQAEGIPYLMRAHNQDPEMPEALMEWGMAIQSQRQFAEAEQKHRAALAIAPAHPLASLYLGSSLHMQGQYVKAQAVYEEALDAHPDVAMLHVNLAGIFYLQKKYAEAEREFREALALEPQLGLAHHNLGILLAHRNRTEEARAELEVLRNARSGYATQMASFIN